MTGRPRVAISLGDPSGIGPEVTAKVLADPAIAARCIPVVFGSPDVWRRGCALAKVADPLRISDTPAVDFPALVPCDATALDALPLGESTAAGGRAQMAYLRRAADALVAGTVDGLCTAPVNKAAIHAAGEQGFRGHTEYLQERFGVPRVVMLMAGKRLRVAVATTHVAVRDVSGLLTIDELVETLALMEAELRSRFGVAAPRIAVCGLNPHAGEGGRFGDEEGRIITPAVETVRARGMTVEGPFPADGLFPRILETGFDAVLAMFHDQGLIPFKMLELHDGVNVTLGLPRPRTSPDHGVAYDIAAKGVADPRSMGAALRLCVELCGSTRG